MKGEVTISIDDGCLLSILIIKVANLFLDIVAFIMCVLTYLFWYPRSDHYFYGFSFCWDYLVGALSQKFARTFGFIN